MPMSSAEIAQMNGAFTQASMNRMSYASAIGQGAIYGGQNGGGGDAIMGGAMSRASSIGGPLLSGAMGLMGLDPMSLGLRAGMGAFGAGAGLGGAAVAGGAVALPLMAAGAAINYGAQQMYQGAGQQMDLNQTLRGSYNFKNQHGGAGFSRGDMTQVGGMMRGMVEQFGPGGEITSMGELTQLAGKMSTMGLAQGVRDVQEFSRRFKDMVGTLKTMAKDLGTTLEGAMEFAAAAKQSGVFGMAHVGRFTGAVRSASVSGGIAMSEVTSAASIGSQISRSIGGLGSQGAMAGIRTIGQIGTAQQMGVLSEEDIYNATGLTGAEGRQAFASSQMQRAGHWLQSGRGRRMLASVAGKNGTLDESAVQQIMAGGMGIQETMAADRSHVTGPGAPVNRANFIRNEGRLRGAAMARFGAFLPALQLQEWAGSKGININEMDDRSMLFAQRQLGMGRDELDAAVKMASNMPSIVHEMQQSERQDQYFQGLAQQRKMQGVSGIKQRYEQARETINNKLQKVGQDVFNSGSEAIDGFLNNLFGTYVETYSKDIDDSMRQMGIGGAVGRRAAANTFGIGGGGRSRLVGGGGGFSLGRASGMDFAAQMRHGASGNFEESVSKGFTKSGFNVGGAFGGGLAWVLAGESGTSQMKRAGFDMSGMSSSQMQDKLQSISMARTAYETSGVTEMAASTRDKIRSAYVYNVGGAGDDRVVSIAAALETSDPVTAARLRSARTPEEKAAIIGQVERSAGIGSGSALSSNYQAAGGIPGVTAPGGFASISEENKAWAKAMGSGGQYGKGEKFARGMLSGYASGLTAGALGLFGVLPLGGAKKSAARYAGEGASDVVGMLTGSYQKEQAAGEFYKGKEFRDLAIGLMSADSSERAMARERIQQAATDVGEKGTNFAEYQKMLSAADAVEIYERTGGDKSKMTDVERKKVEAASPVLNSMAGAVKKQQERDTAEAKRRFKVVGDTDLKRLAVAGVYDAAHGTLTVDDSKLSFTARSVLQRAVDISKSEASGDLSHLEESFQTQAESMGRLSRKERLDIANKLRGTQQGEDLSYTNALEARLGREKRGGLKGILNQELGLGLAAKDMAAMTPEGIAAMAGVTDPKSIQNLQAAFKSGNMFKTAQALRGLQEDEGVKKHKAEVSKAEAEARDPFGAEQVKETKKANGYLEALVKSNKTASLELEKIARRENDKNPENK